MFRDPSRLTRWMVALTCLWLLGSLGQAALYLHRISVLKGFDSDVAPDILAQAIEGAEAANSGLILLTILYHIVFFRWVYVVNRNAQQWSDSMTISPGWNVGWFFVPVAALWKPFEGIRETRGASIAPEDPISVAVPGWLNLWWGLWIVATIYGNILAIFLDMPETPEQWISVSWANAASVVIDVPLALLTCRLLTDIAKLQRARIATHDAGPMEYHDLSKSV